MDFPGPGLVGTLILKNLRHRKLPTPGGAYTSFQHTTRYLAAQADRYAEKASSKERKAGYGTYDQKPARLKLQGFLNSLGGTGDRVMTFEVITYEEGSGDRDCPGLCAGEAGSKLKYLMADVSKGRSRFTSDEVKTLAVALLSGKEGSPSQRRAHLIGLLRSRFPGTSWAVVAAKGDYKEKFTSSGYPVAWAGRHNGMGYVVVAYTSRIAADPVVAVSDAYPVPGQRIRFEATVPGVANDGAVTIARGGTPLCTAFWQPLNGRFVCEITWADAGTTDPVTLTAQYTGGAGFFPSGRPPRRSRRRSSSRTGPPT